MNRVARDTLRDRYRDPLGAARAHAAGGGSVVGSFGAGIPFELAMATGYLPVAICPAITGDAPHASRYFDAGIDRETLFGLEGLLNGELSFLRLAVMTSQYEKDTLLYHAAKEILKRGEGAKLPPLHLYVLLGERQAGAQDYSLDQTRRLARRLKAGSGVNAGAAQIEGAVTVTNKVRRLAGQLQDMRRRYAIGGVEAMEILGAGHFMPSADYAELLEAYLAGLTPDPALAGRPRMLLISGTTLSHISLHKVLEAAGGLVIAEDDIWGARGFGPEITLKGDPVESLFAYYLENTPCRSVYNHERRLGWFYGEAAKPETDIVVCHIPLNDDPLGWDYPRIKSFCEGQGKRLLLLRDDPLTEPGRAAITAATQDFIDRLSGIGRAQ